MCFSSITTVTKLSYVMGTGTSDSKVFSNNIYLLNHCANLKYLESLLFNTFSFQSLISLHQNAHNPFLCIFQGMAAIITITTSLSVMGTRASDKNLFSNTDTHL